MSSKPVEKQRRVKEHFQEALRGDSPTHPFYRAIRKYGVGSFTIEILEQDISDFKTLCHLEEKYISDHNVIVPYGYNLQKGGTGGLSDIHRDSEVVEYLRERHGIGVKKAYEKKFSIPGEKEKYKKMCSARGKKVWERKRKDGFITENYSSGQKDRALNESEAERQKRLTTLLNASSDWWEITFPCGKVERVFALRKYCKDHNLPYYTLYSSYRGNRPSPKGWYVRKIVDE